MTIPSLVPTHRRPVGRISAFDFHWSARYLRIDAATGQTGTGTFAAANNLIGSDGTNLAALAGQPRWQMQDIDGALTGRETATLLFGSSDSLPWDVPYGAVAATMLLEFVQPSSFPSSGTGLLYLGNDGVTGGRWFIDSTGSFYRATYHNGSTSSVSTLAAAPTNGQYVRLRTTLSASGVVQLHQLIGLSLGTETSASAGSAAALAAYGTTTRLRLNGVGTANRTSFAAVRVVLSAATWTLPELVNRF